MYKLLVVDDDEKLCKSFQKFTRGIFDVHYISDIQYITVEYVRDLIKKEMFDLVVFDLDLKGKNGLQIFEKLQPLEETLVIFLSGSSTSDIRVRSLILGAEDFIVKPIDLLELQVKIEKILEVRNRVMYERIGGYVIDNKKQLIYKNGDEIILPQMAEKLLKYLLRNINRDLTRDELINEVWNYDGEGGSRIIDTNINTVRNVTRDPNIVTVRGIGYRYEMPR